MDEKPIFIADQRLYVLKLPADRRVSVKQALQLKKLPEYDAVDQSHHEWDRDKNEPRDWRPMDAADERAEFLQRLGGGGLRLARGLALGLRQCTGAGQRWQHKRGEQRKRKCGRTEHGGGARHWIRSQG